MPSQKTYPCCSVFSLFAYLDEVAKVTASESKTSDSTSVITVDKYTDSRHESAATLEGAKMEKSSSKEYTAPAEVRDKNPTNHLERKDKFTVPVPLTLPKRKNKIPSEKIVKESSDDKKTETKETTENYEQLDTECQQGRKRVGPGDDHQELDKDAEEMVSCFLAWS